MQSHIKFLLKYCQDKSELYNAVASELWVQFGLKSAELSLLCTFIAAEMLKKFELKDGEYEHRKRNIKKY